MPRPLRAKPWSWPTSAAKTQAPTWGRARARRRRPYSGGSWATATGWSTPATPVKFAARDLNKRYAKKFQREMDDDAWAGWAAAKIVSEAVVQEGLDKPAALLRRLWDGFFFDGQKGAALSFRATGQLRQPVLLVQDEDGQLLGEAPVRGAARPGDLDSLGRADCPK